MNTGWFYNLFGKRKKTQKSMRERHAEIEQRQHESGRIHIIFTAMLRIKAISEAEYHKTIVEEAHKFEEHHQVLLKEFSKPDYDEIKKKAVDYYINEYRDNLFQYQVEYVNNPAEIDVSSTIQECLENAYSAFYSRFDYALKSYKQKSAKKKRILYLLEHTDYFIEIAKEWKNEKVLLDAEKAKEEYNKMLVEI